jgi:hypothetical protein
MTMCFCGTDQAVAGRADADETATTEAARVAAARRQREIELAAL